jgi:hypothetical protein
MDCSGIAEAAERRYAWPRKRFGGVAVLGLEVGGRDCMKAVELQSRERAG